MSYDLTRTCLIAIRYAVIAAVATCAVWAYLKGSGFRYRRTAVVAILISCAGIGALLFASREGVDANLWYGADAGFTIDVAAIAFLAAISGVRRFGPATVVATGVLTIAGALYLAETGHPGILRYHWERSRLIHPFAPPGQTWIQSVEDYGNPNGPLLTRTYVLDGRSMTVRFPTEAGSDSVFRVEVAYALTNDGHETQIVFAPEEYDSETGGNTVNRNGPGERRLEPSRYLRMRVADAGSRTAALDTTKGAIILTRSADVNAR